MIAVARSHLLRQINHWSLAAERLGRVDDLASPSAWAGLEGYLGMALRDHLRRVAGALRGPLPSLRRGLEEARTEEDLQRLQRRLVAFRARYLRAETAIDFFVDAINTRTNDEIAGLLRACDHMAVESMSAVLETLGKPVPPVLTYLDRGLGASILKAGLRWGGGEVNPVAGVKIVRHNLFRTTALIHEAGHQVAHLAGWNRELAEALRSALAPTSRHLADIWSTWASEIAADAFAFCHTGYASVVGLHDVLAGSDSFVFRLTPGDPHPTSFVRVLLGVAMCRRYFGSGPWDGLESDWETRYVLRRAEPELADIIVRSRPLLPRVVEVTLGGSMRAFRGRSLERLVDPRRASPAALRELERSVGAALYTTPRWLRSSSVRLLALSGLEMATRPEDVGRLIERQKDWMLRLGRTHALKAA
jgi:hypothetical protein